MSTLSKPIRAIWKFPLRVADQLTIMMPKGAEILSVQVQGERLVLWAFVDPTAALTPRLIRLYGTGWELDTAAPGVYLGTVQAFNKQVWHVYEVQP